MNNAARYTISHSSHGWALIAEHADGSGTVLGYFPTKAEAVETRDALRTLKAGR